MSKRPRWRMKKRLDGSWVAYHHPFRAVTVYNVCDTGLWEVWVNFEMEVRTPHKSVAIRYVVDNGWGLDDE